jgi:hypothetical protein
MKIREEVQYIILSILMVVIGAFIAYQLYFTRGFFAEVIQFSGFMSMIYGLYILSMFLTELIIPSKLYKGKNIAHTYQYQKLKRQITFESRLMCFMVFFITVSLYSSTFYLFFKRVNEYEKYQLTNFGQLQKVRIVDTYYKKSRYAEFKIYYNGMIYTDRVGSKNLNIGDSINIQFSTQNPNINVWVDKTK